MGGARDRSRGEMGGKRGGNRGGNGGKWGVGVALAQEKGNCKVGSRWELV